MSNPYVDPNEGYQQQYSSIPAPGGNGTFDAMDSIGQAWNIMRENLGAWLLSALTYLGVYLLLFAGVMVGWFVYFVQISAADAAPSLMALILFFIAICVSVVAMVLYELVLFRESVYAVGGKRPSYRDFFTFRRCSMLFLVSIVVGLLSMLGLIALIIGSIVISFFLGFAMPAAVFEDMTVGAALKSSYEVVKNNVGQSLLLFVLLYLINAAGGTVLVGMIFTIPFTYIAMSHAYMVAVGRPVQRRN
ncbi:hypothetical protein WG915_08725 [Corynebacterium sp. H128]|uniref:hypothetical protein n=1 Tax=Corynebacterium sp. H128 TaxID=3133427 RepID=UPI0030B0FFCB